MTLIIVKAHIRCLMVIGIHFIKMWIFSESSPVLLSSMRHCCLLQSRQLRDSSGDVVAVLGRALQADGCASKQQWMAWSRRCSPHEPRDNERELRHRARHFLASMDASWGRTRQDLRRRQSWDYAQLWSAEDLYGCDNVPRVRTRRAARDAMVLNIGDKIDFWLVKVGTSIFWH